MITLKSKYVFENRLTKKNEEFQDFNNLLFRYFDLKEVADQILKKIENRGFNHEFNH